jgi:hypothetical protein
MRRRWNRPVLSPVAAFAQFFIAGRNKEGCAELFYARPAQNKKVLPVPANWYPIPTAMVRHTGSQWVVPQATNKAPAADPPTGEIPFKVGHLDPDGGLACQSEKNTSDH